MTTLQASMLSKGFGEVGEPKGASTGTTGSQFLEQYKTAQALAQLAAQHSQTGPPSTAPSSWETSASSLGQYGEIKPFRNNHIQVVPSLLTQFLPPSQIRRLSWSLGSTHPLRSDSPTRLPLQPRPCWMFSCRTKGCLLPPPSPCHPPYPHRRPPRPTRCRHLRPPSPK